MIRVSRVVRSLAWILLNALQLLMRLPQLERLELMQAMICRPELLVELECLASI